MVVVVLGVGRKRRRNRRMRRKSRRNKCISQVILQASSGRGVC